MTTEQSPLYDTFEFVDYLNQELSAVNLSANSQFYPVNSDPALHITPTKGTVNDDNKTFTRAWQLIYYNTITNDSNWASTMQSHVDAIYEALYDLHDSNKSFMFQGWDMAMAEGTLTVTWELETVA